MKSVEVDLLALGTFQGSLNDTLSIWVKEMTESEKDRCGPVYVKS
jgi:hypothetical protein